MSHNFEFTSQAGCAVVAGICKEMDIPVSTISGFQLRVTCGEWEGYKLINRIEQQFNQIGYAVDGAILYQKKRVRKG